MVVVSMASIASVTRIVDAAPTPAPSGSAAPAGKPDLKCELTAWGSGNTPADEHGTVKGIVEANGKRSFEYALKVKNEGGPTGVAFVVRYDFSQHVGDKTTNSSKPNVPWVALGAGQEHATPRLKLSAAAPYPSQHEITVTLDTDNKVAESDETNNTCRVTVKLVDS